MKTARKRDIKIAWARAGHAAAAQLDSATRRIGGVSGGRSAAAPLGSGAALLGCPGGVSDGCSAARFLGLRGRGTDDDAHPRRREPQLPCCKPPQAPSELSAGDATVAWHYSATHCSGGASRDAQPPASSALPRAGLRQRLRSGAGDAAGESAGLCNVLLRRRTPRPPRCLPPQPLSGLDTGDAAAA